MHRLGGTGGFRWYTGGDLSVLPRKSPLGDSLGTPERQLSERPGTRFSVLTAAPKRDPASAWSLGCARQSVLGILGTRVRLSGFKQQGDSLYFYFSGPSLLPRGWKVKLNFSRTSLGQEFAKINQRRVGFNSQ